MDKQKQIEEMADLMSGRVNCRAYDEMHPKCQCFIQNELNATKLYNAGYRKIPENAVVLTREEIDAYEERISAAYELGYKESKNRIIKETAEKFAEAKHEVHKL